MLAWDKRKNKEKLFFLKGYSLGDVYTYCYHHIFDKNVAQDITQETFFRLLKNLDSYKHVGKLKTYLYIIARNIIKDYMKKSKEIYLSDLDVKAEIYDIDNTMLEIEIKNILISYPISYDLTIKQGVIILLYLMYVAVVLMVCVTLLMSSVFKNPYTVIIVDFLIIVIPSFLYSNMGGYLWQHILALFPSKITEFKYDDYITYSVGNLVLDRPQMLIVSYVVVCVIFSGISYHKFKIHEVNK